MRKIIISVWVVFLLVTITYTAERKNRFYMVTEQPKITYYNPKYFKFCNLTSARRGRRDPTYYVGLHIDFVYPMGNNVTVNFYIYELLTNVYKRSFVEMHWKACDLVHKDQFFGAAMRQGRVLGQGCPFAAGPYHLYNMTVPVAIIPPNFPFTKGRIYANVTLTDSGELIGTGHINMELKPYKKIFD